MQGPHIHRTCSSLLSCVSQVADSVIAPLPGPAANLLQNAVFDPAKMEQAAATLQSAQRNKKQARVGGNGSVTRNDEPQVYVKLLHETSVVAGSEGDVTVQLIFDTQ